MLQGHRVPGIFAFFLRPLALTFSVWGTHMPTLGYVLHALPPNYGHLAKAAPLAVLAVRAVWGRDFKCAPVVHH